MMKFSFLVASLLVSIGVFSPDSSEARSRPTQTTNPIFEDATPFVNTIVRVRGVLSWTFENRNLFPLGTNSENMSLKHCLPLLISNGSRELLESVEKKDGRVVELSGRIVQLAPEGMISVTTCKQVGLDVISIN